MLDVKIIDDFRNEINSNSHFAYFKYKNHEDKNKWNIICSCMDWIEISADFLNSHLIRDNINEKCFDFYSYISAIDMIFEAVKQLNRVINQQNDIPFKGDTIFRSEFELNDVDHFKHIRAAFGAHPVNLQDGEKTRWFASWPSDRGNTKYDLSVLLYSNKPHSPYKEFGIRKSELDDFVINIYGYIDNLGEILKNQYNEFREEQIKEKIKKTDNNIEQLDILKKESLIRGFNYNVDLIDTLISLFEAYKYVETSTIIDNYVKSLNLLIEEIFNNLQNMDTENMKYGFLLHPNVPQKTSYAWQKVAESINSGDTHPLFDTCLDEIYECLKEYINIEQFQDYNELNLKILSGFYAMNKK